MNGSQVTGSLALCELCLALVPSRTRLRGGRILLEKSCPDHGVNSVELSRDPRYYRRAERQAAAARPLQVGRVASLGCPLDCGTCTQHRSPVATAIVEIIDDCDMRCPTCIAGSFPGAGRIKSRSDVERMVEASQTYGPVPVMISGGEPTIHPEVIAILRAASVVAPRVYLITNGLRIARDAEFVRDLRTIGPSLEVYLQFDSLRPEVLTHIRGADLSAVRTGAVAALEAADISLTLVAVVEKGVNDQTLGEVVEFGLAHPTVRGVTFQPIRDGGRLETFNFDANYLTLTDVRSRLIEQVAALRAVEFVPHPLSPAAIAIAYLRRSSARAAVTRSVLSAVGSEPPLFISPDQEARFGLGSLFRIAVVAYSDRHSFTTDIASHACLFFVSPSLSLVPADTYYLMYAGTEQPPIVVAPRVVPSLSPAVAGQRIA